MCADYQLIMGLLVLFQKRKPPKMTGGKEAKKIIDIKSVTFCETPRIRIIEDKSAQLTPLVGDILIAMWELDGVFYRVKILEHMDDGRYLCNFLEYGEGIARAEDIYEEISDTPPGSLIDELLQREVDGITAMRRIVAESNAAFRLREIVEEWEKKGKFEAQTNHSDSESS